MKILKIFLILLISLFIYGCTDVHILKKDNDNDIYETDYTDEENHNDDLLNNVILQFSNVSHNWDCDISLDKIKEFNSDWGGLFLTFDGEIYEYNFRKLYSTTNNKCRKITTEIKFNRFIFGTIISDDNEIYAYDKQQEKVKKNPWAYTGNIDSDLFNNDKTIFYIYSDTEYYIYGGIDGNNIYIYQRKNGIFEKELVFVIPDDENFISANSKYIKTNKSYYSFEIINEEEYNKYVDVNYKYGYVKDEKLTKIYDDIYYIDRDIIILKNDYSKIYINTID